VKKNKNEKESMQDSLSKLLKKEQHLVSFTFRIPIELQHFYLGLIAELSIQNKRRISQSELFELIVADYAARHGYRNKG
jgi:hypothetical protein